MTGMGHAVVEQTTPTGTRQTTHGDRLDMHFQMAAKSATQVSGRSDPKAAVAPGEAMQIQSATVEGHVILNQQPVAKHGEAAPQPLQATAGRAVYEESGEWLHLTQNPRVVNGGLELTADKLDLSQATGDAFARGRVKATWLGGNTSEAQAEGASGTGSNRNSGKTKANPDTVLRLPVLSPAGTPETTSTDSANTGSIMDQRKANAQRDDTTRGGRE